MSVLIAILAAGESRRMGTPKLCLPWQNTTILGHILAQWREAGADKILVMHGLGTTPVTLELDRLGVPSNQRMLNAAMDRGMMGSVITAATKARQDPSLTHLIVSLGDQPHLQTNTLVTLIKACAEHPGMIVRTTYKDKSGHPIALPAHLLPELTTTSCATLRDFLGLQGTPAWNLTCDDSGVLLDLDTPDDYAQATQGWKPRPT